jgi:hypothetical protein
LTARAEIARLLAVFNELSEGDKDMVLKISETVIKSGIAPSIQNQDIPEIHSKEIWDQQMGAYFGQT